MTGDASFQVATELWPLIEKGNCVAWVGAGLSKVAGYLGWPDTVDRLCSECGVQHLDPSEKEKADRLIAKAEECKKVDLGAYHRTLASLFGKQVVQTRRALHLLMTLPFKGYVTTNFDPLLSAAGDVHGCDALLSYPYLPITMLEKATRPIFYIHGLARQGNQATGENLVLAHSDFVKAYQDPGIVLNFLTSVLIDYPVVFLNCSLAEPDMYDTFRRVHKIHVQIQDAHRRGNRPQRIALLPTQEIVEEDPVGKTVKRDMEREHDEEARFEAMDVRVIRYKPSDYRHEEVEQILENLKRHVSPVSKLDLEEVVPS